MIERHDDDRRRIDRHRDRYFLKVDTVEQDEHVVECVVRHAEPANFTGRARIVAIEPHERRQVERGRESGLPLRQQELEPLVRLSRRTETGELPHRPQATAVHTRVYAAREWVLARISEVSLIVKSIEIFGCIQRLDRPSAHGRGGPLAGRCLGQFFRPAFSSRAIGLQGLAHDSSPTSPIKACATTPRTTRRVLISRTGWVILHFTTETTRLDTGR
jgi:hypothetical protein